jgi:hypothetical protein
VESGTSLNAPSTPAVAISGLRITFTNIKTLPQLAGQVAKYIEADSAECPRCDPPPLTGWASDPRRRSAFIPNTYEFGGRNARRVLGAHGQGTASDGRTQDEAKAINLSQAEVATLASIVQARRPNPMRPRSSRAST